MESKFCLGAKEKKGKKERKETKSTNAQETMPLVLRFKKTRVDLNSCYANSILQCILSMSSITDAISTVPVEERTNVEKVLLGYVGSDRNEHQSSYKVRQHLGNTFHANTQEDAHEFWMEITAEMNDVVQRTFEVEVRVLL